MGMTDYRSVTDLLEEMEKAGISSEQAEKWATALINIGKSAQSAIDHEHRLRQCGGCETEAVRIHRDWVAILGRSQ
jgi:hypothetical protein